MEETFAQFQSPALDGALAFSGSAVASGGDVAPAVAAAIGAAAGNLAWVYGVEGQIDLGDGAAVFAAAGAFLAGAAAGSVKSGLAAAAVVAGGRLLFESVGSPLPDGVVTPEMNLQALGGGWWVLHGAAIEQMDTEDTSGFIRAPTTVGAALARIQAAGASAGSYLFDEAAPGRSTVYMKSWTPAAGYGSFVPNEKMSAIFKA